VQWRPFAPLPHPRLLKGLQDALRPRNSKRPPPLESTSAPPRLDAVEPERLSSDEVRSEDEGVLLQVEPPVGEFDRRRAGEYLQDLFPAIWALVARSAGINEEVPVISWQGAGSRILLVRMEELGSDESERVHEFLEQITALF
jgi:hypothetical protein